MSETRYLVALSLIREIGPKTQKRLLKRFKAAEAVFSSSRDDLLSVEGVGPTRAEAIQSFKDWKRVDKILEDAEKGEIEIISINDEEYPVPLRDMEDAPIIIYKRGSLREDDRFAIAVVGSRRPTEYGLRVTDIIAGELAEAGFTIVSGLARGIDTQAHKAALLRKGRTIAVLGSGIDIPYPPENLGLMRRIEQSGAVITEFPPGTKPEKGNFPIRNRIISALAMGVLVVEAPSDSGALITARFAMEQGKEVFAVPGMITTGSFQGVHSLLKQGAILVESGSDIIRELAPQLKGFIKESRKRKIELTEEEKILVKYLSKEPIHVDILTRQSRLPLNKVLSIITTLELKGVVRQAEGKRFYLV
jgi:DNA processing protein